MAFEIKKFSLPEVPGISAKTLEEHIKLYEGYVKNASLIEEKIKGYKETGEDSYAISELQRRFAFEFNGMRNHEYYFEQLEGGKSELSSESLLVKQIEKDFGSLEAWLESFKNLCLTRGIGWAILWFDKRTEKLVQGWVDEQHLGHLGGLEFIYGIDMWEHSYLFDYIPAEKKKYVESYLATTNQKVSEERFQKALGA